MEMSRRHLDALPKSVPLPSHRHATPSGPWPWQDIDVEAKDEPQVVGPCPHRDPDCTICSQWNRYPQSHFPNWTPDQVERCKIAPFIENRRTRCKIYHVDVGDEDGSFLNHKSASNAFVLRENNHLELWEWLKPSSRPENIRARAIFIDNMSGPALQILGASYNIEPFFFSSSLNWIPSRFQEDVCHQVGDHITITLTFLRTMPTTAIQPSSASQHSLASTIRNPAAAVASTTYANEYHYSNTKNELDMKEFIDTQAPLAVKSGDQENTLLLDFLGLHMVRNREGSTIISYHADPEWRMTSAEDLYDRFRLVGESVYWKDIMRRSKDPTFLLLSLLWHALYAWDEALEVLYSHICFLEGKVIGTNDTVITRELHTIRAHLLHYESLLDDFHKSLKFLLDTRNPTMESVDDKQRKRDRTLLEKEVKNLSTEIDRLQRARSMQDQRLMNVMKLVFSSVNLEDSRRMQQMTEAAVRDSEAMKQISYLTMVFLPASFAAGIFGMNIKEINPGTNGTISKYVATVVPLTVISIWMIIAFQSKHFFTGLSMWSRLFWPIVFAKQLLTKDKKRNQQLPR